MQGERGHIVEAKDLANAVPFSLDTTWGSNNNAFLSNSIMFSLGATCWSNESSCVAIPSKK